MSVQNIHTRPDIQERAAGLAHTDITNQLTRALNGITPNIIIGQADEPPRGGGSSSVEAEISSVISGQAGRYNGKSITRATDGAATGALAEANLGTASATEDVVIWNLAELGAGTQNLTIGTVVKGDVIGSTSGGKRIIEMPYYSGGAIPNGTADLQVYTYYGGLKNWDWARFHE